MRAGEYRGQGTSLNIDNLISATSLETVLNKLTLGGGSTLDLTTLLGYLGVGSDTTALGSISELLGTLGITIPSTGDLSLPFCDFSAVDDARNKSAESHPRSTRPRPGETVG